MALHGIAWRLCVAGKAGLGRLGEVRSGPALEAGKRHVSFLDGLGKDTCLLLPSAGRRIEERGVMRKRLKLVGTVEMAASVALVILWRTLLKGQEPVAQWAAVVALSTLFVLGATTYYIATNLKSKKDYFY